MEVTPIIRAKHHGAAGILWIDNLKLMTSTMFKNLSLHLLDVIASIRLR